MFRRSFLKLLSALPFFTHKPTPSCIEPNCINSDTLILMSVENISSQNSLSGQKYYQDLIKIVFQYKPEIQCVISNRHSFLTVRNGKAIGYVKADQLNKNDKIWVQTRFMLKP